MNYRGKIKLFILLILFLFIGLKLICFIIAVRTPIKHTVRLENIGMYSNFILVKEAWHTGTGWEKVGDENGLYFDTSFICDVQLEGNVPPEVGTQKSDYANVFLCEVAYEGSFQIPATSDPIHSFDSFEVIEWYPVYPVKRDTLLPKFLYSDEYLSSFDLRNFKSSN